MSLIQCTVITRKGRGRRCQQVANQSENGVYVCDVHAQCIERGTILHFEIERNVEYSYPNEYPDPWEYFDEANYQIIELCKNCDEFNCPVCLNDIKTNEGYNLSCNHSLCKECFHGWFAHNKSCPMCRCNPKNTLETVPVAEVEAILSMAYCK